MHALDTIDKEIKLCNELGYTKEWPAVIGQKSNILNNMNNFQEAYKLSNNIYTNKFYLLKDNATDHADILTQLSRAELGLGKLSESLVHSIAAVSILITRSSNIEDSEDTFLAEAMVAHGDVFFKMKDYEKALLHYNKAERIYKTVYKHNFKKITNISHMLSQGAKVSFKLNNQLLFQHYAASLSKILPSNHERIKDLEHFKTQNYLKERL